MILIPKLSKVMEEMINEQMTEYVDRNNIPNGDQHRFKKDRFYAFNLIIAWDGWTAYWH